MRGSGDKKQKLPIKNDEKPSLLRASPAQAINN
jgi:hypothetical protein